ncbi:MAG TPA: TAXI family TRAP transporter solute-binding subunit [Stellaceae bacterium]|nr:TAXI family TRAP transporter solute-binding subunit [Stellaceae bacterium]
MTTNTTPAVNPNVTRSRLVLEIASEMVGATPENPVPEWFQAKVVLRRAQGGKPVTLFAVSSAEGIYAVAKGEADLAIINPACVLSVAVKGQGMFKEKLPLLAVTVIPSWDQFVFAVRPETGLTRFEDIAARKPKLRIMMRGALDHTLHHMFDDVAAAAGFSRGDIAVWGGDVLKKGSVPWPHTPTFKALVNGEVDALFDEAAHSWVPQALDAGMTILPLGEATVQKLEAMGYRRAVLPQSAYPKLPADVLSIDFSGWTVFVRADADDRLVEQICAGLDARKMRIPWEEPGDLPVERMAKEGLDTPQCVPLHPAAERFWRARGYL